VARHVRTTAQVEAHKANYVGGDIVTERTSARQLVFRPRVAIKPYALGVPGVCLCPAADPPGVPAPTGCPDTTRRCGAVTVAEPQFVARNP
jgi:hypothetical protein